MCVRNIEVVSCSAVGERLFERVARKQNLSLQETSSGYALTLTNAWTRVTDSGLKISVPARWMFELWMYARGWDEELVGGGLDEFERARAALGPVIGITSAGAFQAQGAINAQVFNSNAIWTKPDNVLWVAGFGFGGGGGGGSGESATGSGGGGGGGGGTLAAYLIEAVSSNQTVTIGVGGTGGVAVTSNTGQIGSAGSDTTVGSIMTFKAASGGGGGNGGNLIGGGQAVKSAGGNAYSGSYTANGQGSAIVTGLIDNIASGGGGQGASHSGSFGSNNISGFSGGTGGSNSSTAGGGGGGGGGPNGNGGNGGNGVLSGTANAGGSPANNTGAGGGGGGGQSTNSSPSGAGGTGGSGQVTIVW